MTANLAATYPTALEQAGSEPDVLTLAGEHALLLRGVHRRVWPVLTPIDAGTRPTAELHTLVAFLRISLLRQASDEEARLFPGGAAAQFAELTAQHARLHALTERLAEATATQRPSPELRHMVAELVNVLPQHLATEQELLGGLAEPNKSVPSAAEVANGAQTWFKAGDGPLLIALDEFPGEHAAQLCIERLLRLRPGQRAEIRSSDRRVLEHICGWMREFDSASYGVEYRSGDDLTDTHLRVARRRDR